MIAVIDYRAGNLTSVRLALESLQVDSVITDDPACILESERVIFPGVGAIGSAMQNLQALKLVPTIRSVVQKGTPFLGICLGTQIIFERSEEDGGVSGIGLLPGSVRRFQPSSRADKVPQIGWNQVHPLRSHPVFQGIDDQSEFYFVHSYYPCPADPATILGETDYAGVRFASAVARGNIVATQFHPEKSGRTGLHLLKNFLTWNGRPE